MGEHKIELSDLNTAVVDGKSVSLSDKVFTPEADPKIFKYVIYLSDSMQHAKLTLYLKHT